MPPRAFPAGLVIPALPLPSRSQASRFLFLLGEITAIAVRRVDRSTRGPEA